MGSGKVGPAGPGAAAERGEEAPDFPDAAALRPLLQPRGIAVVGASADPGKFSGRIVQALLACGYGGAVHPVNPRYAEVAGRACYPSLAAVPDPCDLAIVAVPARHVPGVVRQAALRGLGAAVILSAGFDEVGGEGARRADELRGLAGTGPGRIRLYGPNCPGLWQVRDRLVYTFSAQFDPEALRPGPVGLVTQGGALGRAVLDAMDAGVGFSTWFSTGNEVDLGAADFVAHLAQDPETRVVAAIVEGFRDGRRFLAAVERCRRAGKPVVLLKLGRSPTGARAALGHTAAVSGDPGLADAALRAAGCILVDELDELVDLAALLARYPDPPRAGGVGVCTFSGGAGALLADRAAEAGLPLPALRPRTVAALRALLPEIGLAGNPTDLTTAVFEDPGLAVRALAAMARDPGVAALLLPLPHRHDAFDALLAARLAEAAPGLGKPLVVAAISPAFPQESARTLLRDGGLPVLPSARRAALALARWLDWGARGAAARARPTVRRQASARTGPGHGAARGAAGVAASGMAGPAAPGGRRPATVDAAAPAGWGLPQVPSRLVRGVEAARRFAAAHGYPLRVLPPAAVAGDVRWAADARALAAALAAVGTPAVVAAAAPPGPELRCRAVWDAAFGPAVGGALEDGPWAWRLAPLDAAGARALLAELGLAPAAPAARALVHLGRCALHRQPAEAVLRLLPGGRAALVWAAGHGGTRGAPGRRGARPARDAAAAGARAGRGAAGAPGAPGPELGRARHAARGG